MRLLLATAGLLSTLVLGACASSFDGTNVYFEFQKLAPLQRLLDADKTLNDQGVLAKAGICADDAYVAQYGHDHPELFDAFEYHAWATMNGSPVRLARFTVRECTLANEDTGLKQAVTTVSFVRDDQTGYPKKGTGSQVFGVVDQTQNGYPMGGAYMTTGTRLGGATEVFITKEPVPAPGEDLDLRPPSLVLMGGTVAEVSGIITGTLEPRVGLAHGMVTAIIVDRASAW
jgi:hypothetical protein